MGYTHITNRLKLPAIAAPMTAVSGPDFVVAAAKSGIIGSFPTHNAESPAELDAWLSAIGDRLATVDGPTAPIAPNLVVHSSNRRLEADLATIVRHRVELVITSVGSPARVVGPLHDAGAQVFADVATIRHAKRAVDSGVDGLVLLTAGAGGQTGSANPFAFVRAVREWFDGVIVLAGSVSDGPAILAAQILGADLVYLGTRLIATRESMAGGEYQAAIVDADLDDIRLTSAIGGIPANYLATWLDGIPAAASESNAGSGFHQSRLLRNRYGWSAGHGVGSVSAIEPVGDVVATLTRQYNAARAELGVWKHVEA